VEVVSVGPARGAAPEVPGDGPTTGVHAAQSAGADDYHPATQSAPVVLCGWVTR
jgi:hypothetical protein